MKKELLFVYDSMMTGGTTTALLSLLNSIDRSQYNMSLLLYTNEGAYYNDIPDFVTILPQAYRESRYMSSSKRKMLRTIFNGRVLLALLAFEKYHGTEKGNLRTILMHYGMKSQVSLSRTVPTKYDIAIGFMEGWANEYVVSGKINATQKYIWIHPQYDRCYLIPEIDRTIFPKVNGIALVSKNCLEKFNDYFPEYRNKVSVVPNLVSTQLTYEKATQETAYIKKGKINFCTVCRCDVHVKGLDRLLKAFCQLKAEGLLDDIKWHLIGDGKDFIAFKNEVEKQEMTNNIILYGNKINPLPYLLQMDVFILTSRYEGKPVSVTEAQILGLPCIVTNYESAPLQVDNGVNGLIVNNTYEDIYKAIRNIITNPHLIEQWMVNTKNMSFGNESDIVEFYKLIHN